MIIIGSLLLSLIVSYFFPAYIKKSERNLINSAKNIDSEKVFARSPILAILIIFIPFLVFTVTSYDAVVPYIVLTLGIASYCDIKRNWIPDPVIYTLMLISMIAIKIDHSHSLEFYLLNCLAFITPYILINILTHMHSRQIMFCDGDIYLLLSLSFTITPLAGVLVTTASIFFSVIYTKVNKTNNVAFIPFVSLSYCLVYFHTFVFQ
ncbi:hypothetical protein FZI27_20195 [Cronobacter sakazakii]|nr:hypothetical protein FZI27_20195 [Cronobacter sakazakii]